MKKITLMMLALSIGSYAFGQEFKNGFPQSFENLSKINIDLGQKNVLLIGVKNLKNLEDNKNIDSVLVLFLNDYQALKPSLKESTNARSIRYTINSSGVQVLDLQEYPQKIDKIQLRTGQEPVMIKTQSDTLIIIRNNRIQNTPKVPEDFTHFYFIVNNLDDLESINKAGVNTKIGAVFQDIRNYKSHDLMKSYSIQFTYHTVPLADKSKKGENTTEALTKRLLESKNATENEKFLESKFSSTRPYSNSFLSIHASIGVGLIKNQWSTSFQYLCSIVPTRRKNIGYSIGYNIIFDYSKDPVSQEDRRAKNIFYMAGLTFYNNNRKPGTNQKDWILGGIYLGYLNKAEGTMFKDNTWCLSGTIWAKGVFKIQPELYFDKILVKNSSSSVGLRLQVGF